MSAQQKRPSKAPAGVAAVVLAMVIGFVSMFEGTGHNKAYWDKFGKVWTICEGHTGADVKEGTVFTDAQCEAIREKDITIANAAVKRCITVPLLVQIEVALTDGAYNIGPSLVCGSTLQRKALANDWPGACAELHRWDKAGGRVLPGLTRRRSDEAHLCEGRALWPKEYQ